MRYPGHLLIAHPSGRQEAIVVQGTQMRIGSAADNDMVLLGPGIAAHDACIRRDERGDLTIATAGVEIELPRAAAGAATIRIGGYVINYTADELRNDASDYVIRQASVPAQHARIDEVALLSALLSRDEWAAHEPRLLNSHEAVTIEMSVLGAE